MNNKTSNVVNVAVIVSLSVVIAFVLFFSIEEVVGEPITENNRFLIGFITGTLFSILVFILKRNNK